MDAKIKQTDRSSASTGFSFFLSGNFFTGKILFLGLVISQIIAAIHVYLSNTRLFNSLENLKNAGYLTVPNHIIMKSLPEFGPAFYGGLFFTLSAGALLSLLGLVSALIWNRFFKRKKALLIPFMILWAGLIIAINIKGFSPVITAYFLFIPSIVFIIASRYMPPVQPKKTGYLSGMARTVPIILLIILWAVQINSGIFTNIRDHLLLSNGPGKKINDFYYRYTMYPAEAMKSLDQKIIKTCNLDKISDNNLAYQIRKKLINYDFLEVNKNAAVDLRIDEHNNSLNLSNGGKVILTSSTRDFLETTEKTLSEFSIGTDKQDFFRLFTFISLFTGFPAVMIIFFYCILAFMLGIFYNHRHASTVSLFLCLAFAVSVSAFLFLISGKPLEEENLPEALRSANWHNRVIALKIINEKKMDISRFGSYQDMLTSPHIPVRYWLAKALATSRDPESYKALTILMDDPCPNVVCMAYFSTGQRGDRTNIKKLLKRIIESDHWYEQWYAYKALRALGWKQTISK